MADYLIARDGAQLGSFSKTEVVAQLAAGSLQSADLAWCDGMPDWVPLSVLFPSSGTGVPPPIPTEKDIGDDAGMRFILPVGRSGWAIAAGYLGLFGLVVIPAPIALIVSIIAIRDIQKSKTTGKRKHGMGRAIFGLVVGILGTALIVLLIIGMLMEKKAA